MLSVSAENLAAGISEWPKEQDLREPFLLERKASREKKTRNLLSIERNL